MGQEKSTFGLYQQGNLLLALTRRGKINILSFE